MNDFTAGCLEGLAYTLAILNKHFPDEKEMGPIIDAYTEIEQTQLKILAGTAISFRDKVDLIKTKLSE
jgi:hypothetical protein